MRKLFFDRQKYGKELLIDTTNHLEYNPGAVTVLPDFYVIGFLAEAGGSMRINDHQLDLHPNLLFFIPPGQISDVANFRFERGYLLFFQGDFLDVFFQETYFLFKFHFFHNPDAPYLLPLSTADFQSVYPLVESIHQDIRNPQLDQVHFLRSTLYHLLIRINRQYARAYSIENRVISDKRVLRMKYLLAHRLFDFPTTTSLAAELGISRTALHQLCIQYFGQSPGQLIKTRRLLEAKKAILFSDQDIQAIAYELQYSDPSNFNRAFRQATGLTPQQYRKQFTK